MKSSTLVLVSDIDRRVVKEWRRTLTATTTHHYRPFNADLDCTQYKLPHWVHPNTNLIINSPVRLSNVSVCKSVGSTRKESKFKRLSHWINPTVHSSHWVLTTNTHVHIQWQWDASQKTFSVIIMITIIRTSWNTEIYMKLVTGEVATWICDFCSSRPSSYQ